MDFKQLEYFLAIYEEGSMSKAAGKLFISQQGLSKAVLALEKELDCRLFERNPKGVVLTEAGDALLLHAYKMMEERSTLIQSMMQYREHEKLNIAMVIGSRFSLPQKFMTDFRELYPEIEVDVQELKNDICIHNLEHGKVDLAITIQPEKKNGYRYELLKKEKMTIVMPKDHVLANRERIYLEDLQGQPIAFHGGNSSFILMEQCNRRGIHFAKTQEMPGMLAVYQTCSDRGMLGISLESLEGKLQFDNLISIPVHEEDAVWEITLMYHESVAKRNSVRKFLEYRRNRQHE